MPIQDPNTDWVMQMLQNMDQPGYEPPAAMQPNQPKAPQKPFWDVSDPTTQMAAMSAALSMLQPIQPGQSPLGHAAQSLQYGLGNLTKLRQQNAQQATEERKVDVTEQAGKRRDVLKGQEILDERSWRAKLGNYYDSLAFAQKNPETFTDEEKWKLAAEMAQAEYQYSIQNLEADQVAQMFPNGAMGRAQTIFMGLKGGAPDLEALKAEYERERAAAAANKPEETAAPTAPAPAPAPSTLAKGKDIIEVAGEPQNGQQVMEYLNNGTLDTWRKQGFDIKKWIQIGIQDLGAADKLKVEQYLKGLK